MLEAEGPWGGQGAGGVLAGASWREEEGLPGHWCTVGWRWQPEVAFGNMWAALAHQTPWMNLFADLEGVGVEEDMSEGHQWVECRGHRYCGIVDVEGDFAEMFGAELDQGEWVVRRAAWSAKIVVVEVGVDIVEFEVVGVDGIVLGENEIDSWMAFVSVWLKIG